MDNFKEDYSNIESVSTPPVPPTPQKVGRKEKKANAKAEKAAIKAQQAADQAQAVVDQANDKAQKKAEKKAAKAQRPFYKKWWFWVIVLVVIGAMNGKGKKETSTNDASTNQSEQIAQVVSEASSEQTVSVELTPTSPASEASSNENQESKSSLTPEQERQIFVQQHEADFRVITKDMLNNYLANYKIPWTESWQIVPFDDQGAIFVTTKATIEGNALKQPVIAIFTFYPEEEKWTGHFLSVGDYVLYDDHYADEFFENISAFTNGG